MHACADTFRLAPRQEHRSSREVQNGIHEHRPYDPDPSCRLYGSGTYVPDASNNFTTCSMASRWGARCAVVNSEGRLVTVWSCIRNRLVGTPASTPAARSANCRATVKASFPMNDTVYNWLTTTAASSESSRCRWVPLQRMVAALYLHNLLRSGPLSCCTRANTCRLKRAPLPCSCLLGTPQPRPAQPQSTACPPAFPTQHG